MKKHLAFILIFLIASPLYKVISIPAFAIVISLLVSNLIKIKINLSYFIIKKYLFVFFYLSTTCILSLYHKTLVNLPYSLIFLSIYISFSMLSAKDIIWLLNSGSKLLFAVLVMSWIGLLYSSLGFGPIYNFTNPNGDINYLYLTTFSNAAADHIRPGGIYDEPGYLGLYVTIVVFSRKILHLDDRLSALLLIMALITQSIVVVAFTLLWFFNIIFYANFKKIPKGLIWMLPLLLIFSVIIISSNFFGWAIDRLIMLISDEIFNPRLISFNSILANISESFSNLIFGFDSTCIERNDMCSDLGGNPLVPMIFGGLLYSWPYYVAALVIIYSAIFGSNSSLKIGALIVIASQPVMLELPYSTIYLFAFFCWKESLKFNCDKLSIQTNGKNNKHYLHYST